MQPCEILIDIKASTLPITAFVFVFDLLPPSTRVFGPPPLFYPSWSRRNPLTHSTKRNNVSPRNIRAPARTTDVTLPIPPSMRRNLPIHPTTSGVSIPAQPAQGPLHTQPMGTTGITVPILRSTLLMDPMVTTNVTTPVPPVQRTHRDSRLHQLPRVPFLLVPMTLRSTAGHSKRIRETPVPTFTTTIHATLVLVTNTGTVMPTPLTMARTIMGRIVRYGLLYFLGLLTKLSADNRSFQSASYSATTNFSRGSGRASGRGNIFSSGFFFPYNGLILNS